MDAKTKPTVIYVHGMYSSYLSRRKLYRSSTFFGTFIAFFTNVFLSLFTTGYAPPFTMIKSVLLGKNGHADSALPIRWKTMCGDDGKAGDTFAR